MPSRTRQVLGFTSVIGLLCYGVVHPAMAVAGEQIRRPRPDPGTSGSDAGSLAPWEDQEIRSTYLRETDETQVWLALQPVDPVANEARLTLTLGARFNGRSPSVPPRQIEMRATMHPLSDPRVTRLPVMTFLLNADTEDSEQLELSGIFTTAGYLSNPTGPLNPSGQVPSLPTLGPLLSAGEGASVVSSSVDTVLFALPLGLSLLRLINSETVQGTAVGFLDFSFTETQLNVLRDFAQQLLSPQAADTQTGRYRIRAHHVFEWCPLRRSSLVDGVQRCSTCSGTCY